MASFDELYEAYKRKYAVIHQPPAYRPPSFAGELGFDSLVTTIVVISSMLLSSIRTATVFALEEASLLGEWGNSPIGGVLPAVSALLSLVVFEGVLVAWGYIEAKTKGKKDIPKSIVYLALATVILAGFQASLGIIQFDSKPTLIALNSWLLATLTSIAPPLIAYFGGTVIGAVHVRWMEIVRSRREQYDAEFEQWESSLRRSFLRAYQLGKLTNELGNQESERHNEHTNERTSSRTSKNANANANSANDNREHEPVRSSSTVRGKRSELVRELIERYIEQNGKLPKLMDVCAELSALDENGRPPEHFKGAVHPILREYKEAYGASGNTN